MCHTKSIWLMIVALLMHTSCATVSKTEPLPSLFGMVYDHENRPISDVEISTAGTSWAHTDINGRFTIPELKFGTYEFSFHKANHEDVQISLNFSDATSVLYVKMISAEQLLAEAELELGQRRWSNARSCIDRALHLVPDNPSARYLEAVLAFRMDDTAQAVSILHSLLTDGYNESYVHLFLADLYQYKLRKPQDAFEHLAACLSLRYDPDIERRRLDLAHEMTQSAEQVQK